MNLEAKPMNAVEQRRQELRVKRIKDLLGYLEEKYHVIVPEGTEQKIIKCSMGTEYPTRETVDALVRQWYLWKEYLSVESYSQFILSQLISLFHIQVSAVSESPQLNSYVGAIEGVSVVKTPPRFYSTCLGLSNALKLKGVEV